MEFFQLGRAEGQVAAGARQARSKLMTSFAWRMRWSVSHRPMRSILELDRVLAARTRRPPHAPMGLDRGCGLAACARARQRAGSGRPVQIEGPRRGGGRMLEAAAKPAGGR